MHVQVIVNPCHFDHILIVSEADAGAAAVAAAAIVLTIFMNFDRVNSNQLFVTIIICVTYVKRAAAVWF